MHEAPELESLPVPTYTPPPHPAWNYMFIFSQILGDGIDNNCDGTYS